MSDLIEKNGKATSLCWKEPNYKRHENEMIRILKEACDIALDGEEHHDK